MTDDEAIAECKRWLAHLDRKKQKSLRIQELARMARESKEGQKAAVREMALLDSRHSVTVYDAANLQTAVQHLVDHFHEWKIY